VGVDVSVCVATFRRPEGLARLLDSLGRMKLPHDLAVEVVVVDDDPEASAARLRERYRDFPLPVRWVHEPAANISLARNRSVEAATGDWVAFVDDDEVVDEDWLAAYWRCQAEGDVDGWCGPVPIQLEAEVDSWVDPRVFFARKDWPTGMPLTLQHVRTGNAFMARRLFDPETGRRFDPFYGRIGGEDTDLFGRLLEDGVRLAWCNEARVTEFYGPERCTFRFLMRRYFASGVNLVHFELRGRGFGNRLRVLARTLWRLAGSVVLMPVWACRGRVPAAQMFLRFVLQVGRVWGLFGNRHEQYGGEG
jgi:succinoglycan biosynthesis protein ExoM